MLLARIPHSDGTTRVVASDSPDGPWRCVRSHLEDSLVEQGATRERAAEIATCSVPDSMAQAVAGGDQFLRLASAAIEHRQPRIDAEVLSSPLDPTGYRDFMVFEEHFALGYRWRDVPVPDVMYEFPVSYFGNPKAFLGPGDEVPWPSYSEFLDYELELGIVIGKPGRNLTPDQALDHVLGFTILNDLSARDIQVREMAAGLGPSKGKHFACVVGPVIATLDEIPTDGLRMIARINGETACDTTSDQMVWSVAEIVAWASQEEDLVPGMLLGTGTCNGGSTLESGHRLRPGDVLEFEVERLGVLRNTIGSPQTPTWTPAERARDADGRASRLSFLS